MANEYSKQAKDVWDALPEAVKENIINNIYCGQCRGVVKIGDYKVILSDQSIVLQGICTSCAHKVARVIEEIARD